MKKYFQKIKLPHALQLHNGSRFTKYVLPYLVVILTLIVLLTGYIAIETRQNLINNCKENGNPLRIAVSKVLNNQAKKLDKELAQSYAVNYKELFPKYDPVKLEELIAKNRKEIKEEKKSIAHLIYVNRPIDCDAQF